MTEDEAIAILEQQFVSDAGFLAELRRHGTLDECGVAQVRKALTDLEQVWSQATSVPRRAVFALEHLELLERLIERFPDLNLDELFMALQELAERCLTPGEWAMAEWRIGFDGAERTLIEEFLSEDGFLMWLHAGYGVERESVERIQGAIQSLRAQYHGHERIPKAVAYVLELAPDVIRACWGIYWNKPPVQTELLALADDLGRRIRDCLRDEPVSNATQMKMDLAE